MILPDRERLAQNRIIARSIKTGAIFLFSILSILPITSQSQSMITPTNANLTNAASKEQTASNTTSTSISIVPGAANFLTFERFYDPQIVHIKIGETVKWINNDSYPHTVFSGTPGTLNPPNYFSSGIIYQDGIYEHTFNMTGSFDYFCELHPWGVGKVIVS